MKKFGFIPMGILGGLAYTLFYYAFFALRWGAGGYTLSYATAVAAGIAEALIVSRGRAGRTLAATLIGLLSSFGFLQLFGRLGLFWGIFLNGSPGLENPGMNDRFEVGVISVAFMLLSFLAFLSALGVMAFIRGKRRGTPAQE